MRKSSFTLVELVTVVAVIGIGSALFYLIFILNWSSFDNLIARVDLRQEANQIIEKISFEGRWAERKNIPHDKTLVLFFPDGTSTTYTFTSEGELQRLRGTTITILSRNVDFSNSSFEDEVGGVEVNSFIVNLVLEEDVFGRRIEVRSSTEIYLRNL